MNSLKERQREVVETPEERAARLAVLRIRIILRHHEKSLRDAGHIR